MIMNPRDVAFLIVFTLGVAFVFAVLIGYTPPRYRISRQPDDAGTDQETPSEGDIMFLVRTLRHAAERAGGAPRRRARRRSRDAARR